MSRTLLFLCAVSFILARTSPVFGARVDFQREVQPILSEHCAQCHGADAKARKGKLRLDTPEGALKGGSSGDPAVVPGQPEKSPLIQRVSAHDEDTVMPPPSQKKPLSDTQRKVLKQWITEGAKYEAHWAYTAPKKAPLPDVGATSPDRKSVV